MFHHGRDLIIEVKGLIAVVNRYGGIIDIEVEIISSRQKKIDIQGGNVKSRQCMNSEA